MKKRTFLFFVIIMVLVSLNLAYAETAYQTDQRLMVDGKMTPLKPYTINGTTYYGLRDLSVAFKDSQIPFMVAYDEGTKSVYLYSGQNNDDVYTEIFPGNLSATKSKHPLYLNPYYPVNLDGYTINGRNYFSLRDLGDEIGFYVGYDKTTRTVIVDTSKGPEFSQSTLDRKVETMVKYAESLVGQVSYEEADCSTFVGACLQYAGIDLYVPPWTWTIGESPSLKEIPVSELKRGDILNRADRPNQHVMIYIGNNKVVESVPRAGVRIGSLRTENYKAYRIISY